MVLQVRQKGAAWHFSCAHRSQMRGVLLAINQGHAVVSRNLDNWIEALKGLEKRANDKTIVLAGHGEPTGVAAFGDMKAYLNAVKPLMLANIGKPEQADVIVKEIAEKFPSRRMPQLLKLGLSRALPN